MMEHTEKNVFGVRDDAERIDGAEFVIREVDAQERERIDSFGVKAQETFSIPTRPRWKRMLTLTVLYIGVAMLLFGIPFGIQEGVSLGQALAAHTWFYLIALVLIVVGAALTYRESRLEKRMGESEQAREMREESEELDREVYAFLNVPTDAVATDVLVRSYQIKDGREKNAVYTAFDMRAFREGDKLCFADVGSVVGIPLERIGSIVRVDRTVKFYFWNKKEAPDSAQYKPYNIRNGFLSAHVVASCIVLHIQGDSGEYEILIPPYEEQTIRQLTGMPVAEPYAANEK